jgi:hypothetical protein
MYQEPDEPDESPTVANIHFSSGNLLGLFCLQRHLYISTGMFVSLNAEWQCSYIHGLNNFVILICCTNDDGESLSLKARLPPKRFVDVVSLGEQLVSIPPLSALWASTTLARLFYTTSATPNSEFYMRAACPAKFLLISIPVIQSSIRTAWLEATTSDNNTIPTNCHLG